MRRIQARPNWQSSYPAAKWCADLGSGWYLPAMEELLQIYREKEKLNQILKKKKGVEIGEWYCSSSTEYDQISVWLVNMGGGYTQTTHKYNRIDVRAVSAF